jgi:hypothetical protein
VVLNAVQQLGEAPVAVSLDIKHHGLRVEIHTRSGMCDMCAWSAH